MNGKSFVSHKNKNMTDKRICETSMTYKEQRIDFPDYTAENQERDAQRHLEKQKKDVYIVKTSGRYGAFIPTEEIPLSSNCESGEEFTHFIKRVDRFVRYRLKVIPKFHCIINKGIEDHIKQQMIIQNLLKEK